MLVKHSRLGFKRVRAFSKNLKSFVSRAKRTAEELTVAPIIDNYVTAIIPAPSIIGYSPDHPTLTGSLVTTSEVWVCAPDLGWCRTMTRFYRLGRPLKGGVQ